MFSYDKLDWRRNEEEKRNEEEVKKEEKYTEMKKIQMKKALKEKATVPKKAKRNLAWNRRKLWKLKKASTEEENLMKLWNMAGNTWNDSAGEEEAKYWKRRKTLRQAKVENSCEMKKASSITVENQENGERNNRKLKYNTESQLQKAQPAAESAISKILLLSKAILCVTLNVWKLKAWKKKYYESGYFLKREAKKSEENSEMKAEEEMKELKWNTSYSTEALYYKAAIRNEESRIQLEEWRKPGWREAGEKMKEEKMA